MYEDALAASVAPIRLIVFRRYVHVPKAVRQIEQVPAILCLICESNYEGKLCAFAGETLLHLKLSTAKGDNSHARKEG